MKKFKLLTIALCLTATTLVSTANVLDNLNENSSFKKTKIKTKANSTSNIAGGCYMYVAIFSNAMWDIMREKFKLELEVKKNFCKKITIYQTIQGVHETGVSSILRNTFSKDEYKLDLGVILEEEYAHLDIELITVIANSDLGVRGISDDKVNTGIIVEGEALDVSNEYKASTSIIHSKVGKEDILTQAGINLATDFLKEDKDSPFASSEEEDIDD